MRIFFQKHQILSQIRCFNGAMQYCSKLSILYDLGRDKFFIKKMFKIKLQITVILILN